MLTLGASGALAWYKVGRTAAQTPPRHSIAGTVTIEVIEGMVGHDDASCWGMGPYKDVRAGAELKVSGRSGLTLARAELPPGQMEGLEPSRKCRFAFTVDVVGGEGTYYFEVADHGRTSVAETDVRGRPVDITVGDS